jgi:hypothetical protein
MNQRSFNPFRFSDVSIAIPWASMAKSSAAATAESSSDSVGKTPD